MVTFDVVTYKALAPATTIIAGGSIGATQAPELGLQEAPLDGYVANPAATFAEEMRGMGANADGIVYLHANLNPLEYFAALKHAHKAKKDYNELEKLLKIADKGNPLAMSSVKKLDVSGFFKALDSRWDVSLFVLVPLFQRAALYGNIQALAALFKVAEAEIRDPKTKSSTTVGDWANKIALSERFSDGFKEAVRKHPDIIKIKDGLQAFYEHTSERNVTVGQSKFADHLNAFAEITGFAKGDLINLDMHKAEQEVSLDGNLVALRRLYLLDLSHAGDRDSKKTEFELHLRSIDPHPIVERLKTIVATWQAGDEKVFAELVSNEQALDTLIRRGNERARAGFIEYLDVCETKNRLRADMLMHTMGKDIGLNHKRPFISDLLVAANNGSTMALEQIYYLLEKTVLQFDDDMVMFRAQLAALAPTMIGKKIRGIVESGNAGMAASLAKKVDALAHLAVEYRNDAALNEFMSSYPSRVVPAIYARFKQLDGTEKFAGKNRKYELFTDLLLRARSGDGVALAYMSSIAADPNVAYGDYNYKQLAITYLANGMIGESADDSAAFAGLLMLAVAGNPNDKVLAERFKTVLMNTRKEVVIRGLTLFLDGRPFAEEIRSLLDALKEYAWRNGE